MQSNYFIQISSVICGILVCLSACPGSEPKSKTQDNPDAAQASSHWPPEPIQNKDLIQKGRQLFNQTAALLGPDQSQPELKLAGNRLNCSSCHLNEGKQHNALSLIGIAQRYPAYYAPLDQQVTLEQRVNACFQRSLNGKTLPPESLRAFTAYLEWISTDIPQDIANNTQKLPVFNLPARPGKPESGQKLYTYHCAACHGAQGQGVAKDEQDPSQGYTFPPVWGSDSFSKSSNLARLSILTHYIKGAMPLNRPVLRPEEAYDLAAWLLIQDRPEIALQKTDYPNLKTKPFDVLYGPFEDNLPLVQHQLGPIPDQSQSQ